MTLSPTGIPHQERYVISTLINSKKKRYKNIASEKSIPHNNETIVNRNGFKRQESSLENNNNSGKKKGEKLRKRGIELSKLHNELLSQNHGGRP